MTDKQKNILILGVAVAVVAGLYPPWNYTFDARGVHSLKPAGYYVVFEPPAPEEKDSPASGVCLDTNRLLVEWVVIALAVYGMMYWVKYSDQRHYQRVFQELQNANLKDDLWARAFAEAEGKSDRAKARYIKLRVDQLAEEERIQAKDAEADRRQRAAESWKRLFLSLFRKIWLLNRYCLFNSSWWKRLFLFPFRTTATRREPPAAVAPLPSAVDHSKSPE